MHASLHRRAANTYTWDFPDVIKFCIAALIRYRRKQSGSGIRTIISYLCIGLRSNNALNINFSLLATKFLQPVILAISTVIHVIHLSTHRRHHRHSHHPSLLHFFTPSSKPTFSTNASHLNFTSLPIKDCMKYACMTTGLDQTYHTHQFIFRPSFLITFFVHSVW